jgi:hypothetical protein
VRILIHVLFEATLDATFVESEELKVSAFGDPDASLRQGGIHFGVTGSDFVGLGDAGGEDRRSQTSRVFQAPAVVSYGLD